MKGFWLFLVVGVSTLDAVILVERLTLGGNQRALLHGAGTLLLPFYLLLIVAWFWLVAELSAAHRLHLPVDWKRVLVLAALASLPLVL